MKLPRRFCLIGIFTILALALSYTFFPTRPLPEGVKVEKLLLEKKKRKLTLLGADGKKIRSYSVSLGANPKGHKEKQGDERTPEGNYVLDFGNPNSRFYRSLHVSYPNSSDRSRSRKHGNNPGGDIMIHGLPNNLPWIGRWHRWWDWTDGCIGLTNKEMAEIWKAVKNRKVPIEIRP
ncbi:MAG: L,D-transpeptidase family protein [Verrucomicrobiales bacterium]|nr:L,D-transpeptidase family protein [Verrucomicrobiales bacterium]